MTDVISILSAFWKQFKLLEKEEIPVKLNFLYGGNKGLKTATMFIICCVNIRSTTDKILSAVFGSIVCFYQPEGELSTK